MDRIAQELIRAAEIGNKQRVNDLVDQLLAAHKDLNSVNEGGRTAIMRAALHGHGDIVHLLIDKGADIHMKDSYGRTAIMWAAWKGHGDIVQLLWEYGADLDVRDEKGDNAFDYAKSRGHGAVCEFVQKKSLRKNQEGTERAVAEKQRLEHEEALQKKKKKQKEEEEAEAAAAAEVKRQQLLAEQQQRQKKQKEEEEARVKAEAEAAAAAEVKRQQLLAEQQRQQKKKEKKEKKEARVKAEAEAAAAAEAKRQQLLAEQQQAEKERLRVQAEEETARMQSPLYVWLKTILTDQPQATVVSILAKFQKIPCDSPQDIIDSQLTKSDLQNDMEIPFPLPARIMKSLKSLSSGLPAAPTPPQTSSSPLPPPPSAVEYTVFGWPIVMHKAGVVTTPGILFGHFVDYSGEEVPVVLKLAQTVKGSVCRDLTRESAILRKLNDNKLPSVVRMFEFNASHSPAYLVLKAFGISMETFLKSHNLPVRKVIAQQLSEAVHSIHGVGLMHGDLKPSNVLVRLDSSGGVELKLTDFDSARFIGRGDDSLYPHIGPQLKYTMAWVGGPEVLFGSGGVLQAALSIDLFALGLVLTVLLRPQCAPSSTALPSDEAKLQELLRDETALCAQLQVHGHRHAPTVTRLCRLKPECRGTAFDVVTELQQAGATVLHRENQRLKGDNVFLKEQVVQRVSKMHVDVKATHDEVLALRNDIVTLHEDVLAKLAATTSIVLTELTGTMLEYSKEAQTRADSQFAALRDGLGEEVAGVRALLESSDSGKVLGVDDLQHLSQDLLSSFMQCAGQMSAATEDSVRTACGEMQLSLQAAVSSEQQASHAEIVAMLTTYEEQLSSLQQSSQEVLASVQVIRDHQQEVVETTRDLLLNGNAELVQAVADFSDELSSLSAQSSTDFVAEMEKLAQRDERMEGFVSDLAGILEDMQDSHEASADFQTQSLLMMTQMGRQLRHIAREVEVVHSKVDSLPGKVCADTGVLMAAHSSTLLEHMQAVHDKVSSSLQGFEKARKSEQLFLLKSVEDEVKAWLSATLTEAGDHHSEAVMEAIHAQHKMTAQTIAELQRLHAKSQEGNRQAQKESKAEVFNMLTDMKSTLSEVLTTVSSCEQTCLSLSDSVSRLTSEGSRETNQTQALLSALQQATLDTKMALDTETRKSQSGDKSDAVLEILEEMRVKFNEQLRQQEVSTELQASLNSALEEMRQQQAESDAGSQVGLAATQQKLDVVLSALEESGKQLKLLQAMSAAQHEMLAVVEKRGNLLPRQFIIVPDMQPLKTTPGSILKSIKRKACRVFWRKVRLFFVCDISDQCALEGGPEENGYEIEIPTKALKALLPVLVGSVAVLKVVLQLHGVPAGLVPSLPDLPGDSIVQALMDGLPSGDEAVDQMASYLTTHGEGLQTAEEQLSGVQEGQVDELYRLVQRSEGKGDGANSQLPPLSGWEPRYTGLSKVSVRAGSLSQSGAAAGGSRWVLPEHVDLYAQHGDEARDMLQQQLQQHKGSST